MKQDIAIMQSGLHLVLDGYKFWVDHNLDLWCFIDVFHKCFCKEDLENVTNRAFVLFFS